MVGIARIANGVGRLILDNRFQKTLAASLRGSTRLAKQSTNSRFTNFGKQISDAFVAAEKQTNGNGFFKDMKNLIVSLPKDIQTAWKGAKGFKGKAGALLNTLKSRGPLVGAGLLVAFELPNIIRATWNEGVIAGAGEAAKASARLGAGALGACIGTALFPGIGSVIGGIVGWSLGDAAMGKIVGKSYTEKKEEQERKLQEALAQNNQVQMYNNAQVMNDLLASSFQPTTATGTTATGTTTAGMTYPQNFGQMTLNQAQIAQMQNALYGDKKLDLQI